MKPIVNLGGRGEERGDRAALHEVQRVIDEAPLDVLGRAKVGLHPPPQRREAQRLGVCERRGGIRHESPLDELRAVYGEAVGLGLAGDEGVAQAQDRLHTDAPAVPRDGIRGEHHPRGLGAEHPLDDHGHAGGVGVEALLLPGHHRPLGEQRGPHGAQRAEHGLDADHVEMGVGLPSERRGGRVLDRGA